MDTSVNVGHWIAVPTVGINVGRPVVGPIICTIPKVVGVFILCSRVAECCLTSEWCYRIVFILIRRFLCNEVI
jgi:hypothetical protein